MAAIQKPKPIPKAVKTSPKKQKAKVFIFLANERKLLFFIIFSVRFIVTIYVTELYLSHRNKYYFSCFWGAFVV